jgi:hypothetical protein
VMSWDVALSTCDCRRDGRPSGGWWGVAAGAGIDFWFLRKVHRPASSLAVRRRPSCWRPTAW